MQNNKNDSSDESAKKNSETDIYQIFFLDGQTRKWQSKSFYWWGINKKKDERAKIKKPDDFSRWKEKEQVKGVYASLYDPRNQLKSQ